MCPLPSQHTPAMGLQIGKYQIESRVLLAPMAGITDAPVRKLCREQGAGMTYSEMLTSDTSLWNSRKSSTRLPDQQEPLPRAVQIAGYCPDMMATAAARCEELGAGLIDINMGCPAKKVCKRDAGSALLRDEALVERILKRVVDAVSVPVTLKTRTGWDHSNLNAIRVAQIAEQAGIQALTLHGRTRACRFRSEAEHDTTARVVQSVSIPVIANGDIDSVETAVKVLNHTGAAGLMIGRAAQGNPWIFRRITAVLSGQPDPGPVNQRNLLSTLVRHLEMARETYPDMVAARIMRKHAGWYVQNSGLSPSIYEAFKALNTTEAQSRFVHEFCEADQEARAA